jgi:hypothetical protein
MNRTCRPLVLRLSAMLGVTAALTGCLEPSTEVTKPTEAQALADSLVYVKAKNGLCFGVGTTSRMDSGAKLSYTNQVVHVPCAAVGL